MAPGARGVIGKVGKQSALHSLDGHLHGLIVDTRADRVGAPQRLAVYLRLQGEVLAWWYLKVPASSDGTLKLTLMARSVSASTAATVKG